MPTASPSAATISSSSPVTRTSCKSWRPACNRRQGATSKSLQADLTKDADLKRVEALLASDAEITLLINNAGIYANAKLADHDLQGDRRYDQAQRRGA